MSTYNLNINRSNFKQQRQCYNITVKEIADICNLSPQTIINFEKGSSKYTDTMSRDYNSDMMCQTLESLITKQLDEIKVKNLEYVTKNKEAEVRNKNKSDKKRLGGIFADTDIPRQAVVDYIKAYCSYNKISTNEFCGMCKINRMYTAPSSAKRDGYYITVGTLNRILDATGWTKEQILAGFKPEEKSAFKLKLVDKKEPDIPKHGDLVKKSTDVEKNVTNVRYICENGKIYKEYDIISHVSKEITMEDFIKEVSAK